MNELIEFKDLPNTDTPINAENLNNNFENLNSEVNNLIEHVLYDNTDGSNEDITLSDSAANYSYIEIFYKDNDITYNSVKVYEPNSKYVNMDNIAAWAEKIYIKRKRINVVDTKIKNDNYAEAVIENTPSVNINTSKNNIYITRVVGYK